MAFGIAGGLAMRPDALTESASGPTARWPWAVFAAVGIGIHALLLSGALLAWPVAARTLLAAMALFMVPGFALVRMGLAPPGGDVLTAGWALGFGVAWNAALVLIARAAGQPVFGLERVTLLASIVFWGIALAWNPGRARSGLPRPGRIAVFLIVLAAACAALYVGRLGALVVHQSDSPDHIGTIRRITASGDAFPQDAFFRGAGPDGVDPRKGAWHPQVAMLSRLARVDPYDAWRWLPALVAPMFVLNVAVLGLLAGRGAGAAIAAWMFLLTYGGTLAQTPLRQSVYSARLGEQLALAATAAILADLVRPSARWRVAGGLLAFAAVTTHLFSVVHLAVPLGALGIALLIRDRGIGASLRRLILTSLVAGAAALPFLLWRLQQAYSPENVIHTEPQGLLYLSGMWRVASPGFLWTTFSWGWVLFPLLWIPLWKWSRREPVALWILAATFTAAMLAYNPLVVGLIEPRVGYLIPRFLWFVPLAVLLAWALPRLWPPALRGPARGRALVALAAIAVALMPALKDAVAVVPHPEETVQSEWPYQVLRWRDGLNWMREHLPQDAVVLSDPVTSYSIPMMAGRYVVTLVDQHSSPNDAQALDRLLDSRDALDAYSTWDRVREVVDRYGANVIALNDRFEDPPRLDYWGPQPGWFAESRARFDRHPGVFENVFDTGDFVIYRVHGEMLDTLSTPPPPRPVVLPWNAAEFPPGRRIDEGMPALHGVRYPAETLAPGDTLRAVALWRAETRLPPGSWSVAVRLDRPVQAGWTPPRAVGKPWRKLIEKVRGERYRIRSNHLPTGGAYGVDRWRANEVVRDSFQVVIPMDTAPGDYVLQVRMSRQPHYPNHHLSDYFFDEDLFSGVPSGTVRIEQRGDGHVRD
jgi:hypothetical protein